MCLEGPANPWDFVNGTLTSLDHARPAGASSGYQRATRERPGRPMAKTLRALPLRSMAAAFAAGSIVAVSASLTVLAQADIVVSQKGRMFHPSEISINRGAAIVIVNDDADLLHHAYIDSNAFKFDSGDQEPGSKSKITFSTAGTFEVLCAIHPKMKLTVRVN
jgi:plastocyanin